MKTAQKSTTKTAAKATSTKQATGRDKAKATAKTAVKKPLKEADPLSMCPVNGAGWCPYPFSVAQLKRRLKAKEEAARAAANNI
jgi:hypothetical protein